MNLPSVLEIEPISGPLQASVRPPGSKSITNRALVCAALADGDSMLTGSLDSEDTQVMIESLRKLGFILTVSDEGRIIHVGGQGGRIPASQADLFVGNSGTTIRFLSAMVALGKGSYRLDGVARMRERPIEDQLEALRQMGVDVASELGNGCPPVVVQAHGLPGGRASVRGDVSSQFLSGLLLAAPAARSPVMLEIEGELVSKPYIEMTLRVMQSFGAEVAASGDLEKFWIGAPKTYQACDYEIEPDASAASYFWAAAAICGGSVTVEGLSRGSLQGDVQFVECLREMGCEISFGENHVTVTGNKLRGITVNMNGISDTVQTLGAVALFAEGPTTVTGVGHIRHKETDRIAALAAELRKLGAAVREFDDGLTITPGKLLGTEIETYNDHRMAMSLALVGMRTQGVRILNPGCTAKTYPHFFEDLERLSESNRVSD